MEPTPPPPVPTPIPVEGTVQIFADPDCTRYPTGETDTLYVRINEPWTEGWKDPVPATTASVFLAWGAPDYDFSVYADFSAIETGPYSAGQVVIAKAQYETDVTGYRTVFNK